MADPAIDRFVITDTVPPFRLGSRITNEKIDVLPVGELLAEAIRRLYLGKALTDLIVF